MSKTQNREIKHKSIFVTYLLMFATFGIYGLVWTVKSKRDMNSLGAEIPTSWLLLIPIVGVFWMYKYSEGFATHIEKDDATVKWFALHLFVGFLTPFFVQSKLNEISLLKNQNAEIPKQVEKKKETVAA